MSTRWSWRISKPGSRNARWIRLRFANAKEFIYRLPACWHSLCYSVSMALSVQNRRLLPPSNGRCQPWLSLCRGRQLPRRPRRQRPCQRRRPFRPPPRTRRQLAAGSTTPAAASALTWDSSIGALFQAKCGTCHGAAATGGLNLSTYADAMKGGNTGPVIVPGDSTNSVLVIRQQAGNHPGQLTPEEMAQVIEWIDAGAPEK